MDKYSWKVPFRQVYCDSFMSCLKATVWCLFVLKVFPHAHDYSSDPVDWYLEDQKAFAEQHRHCLLRVQAERRGQPYDPFNPVPE